LIFRLIACCTVCFDRLACFISHTWRPCLACVPAFLPCLPFLLTPLVPCCACPTCCACFLTSLSLDCLQPLRCLESLFCLPSLTRLPACRFFVLLAVCLTSTRFVALLFPAQFCLYYLHWLLYLSTFRDILYNTARYNTLPLHAVQPPPLELFRFEIRYPLLPLTPLTCPHPPSSPLAALAGEMGDDLQHSQPHLQHAYSDHGDSTVTTL
jgi:hypothetical protein